MRISPVANTSDGGGGESSKEIESHLKKKRRKNGEFSQAIARIAVTQVCESVGFQQSALDTLSNVACKHTHEIGKTSGLYANLAGRTEYNVFNLVQGLEDLNLSQGFVGAYDRDNCLSGSGIIEEILQYVNSIEEIGFSYSVPLFPITKEQESKSEFFTSIPSAITDETQIQPDKIDQEHKILESLSLKSEPLQTRNETLFPVILEQPGEKEISVISLPAKVQEEDMVQNNLYHVCEVDAPENEGVRSWGNEIVESVRNVILNNRHAVEMRFHIAKKPLDVAKAASWFLNDEKE
ncbi:hypothetical protein E3N88_44706 [Mikania micrantha]|uniref:Bromodomain associated domain-containing protein n=1 Tax=Mikania micrantha TaxID=192012 RepID=A0A5N6LBH3_9ASTR|nr:hypothetical protein E3N88_44706 [Mikania micrantha]